MRLLVGEKHETVISKWCGKQLGCEFGRVLHSIGIIPTGGGALQGAAVLHDLTEHDVELSMYGPRTLSMDLCRLIGFYCFVERNLQRLTVVIPRHNKRLRLKVMKLGFIAEGTKRRYYGPYRRHDGIMFGMLRSEAVKFLKGFDYGKRAESA